MFLKIIVCLLIACYSERVLCKPWAQHAPGFNYSSNSPSEPNWKSNPYYRGESPFSSDVITTAPKPLYPTLRPQYQPDPHTLYNNYPQPPYDFDGQRSVPANPGNPNQFPLQPNLSDNYDNRYPNDNHQAIVPPFGDNRPNSYPGDRYNNRPYNRTNPTYGPTQNNHNYDDRDRNRYNPNFTPGSNPIPNTPYNSNNFNGSRNNNPQYPYQGSMNGGMYPGNVNGNGNQQPYGNNPQIHYSRSDPNPQPNPFDNRNTYDQRPTQRPISPYGGNSQNNYNNGQPTYNPNSNNNNNNFISGRSSFQPSAPSKPSSGATSHLSVQPLQPDYDPNGIALAPFPGDAPTSNDRNNFNFRNLHNRQPSKYNNPSSTYNRDTLHVPLAPLAPY